MASEDMAVADLVIDDIPYVSHNGETQLARVYRRPNIEGRNPAIVDVHPGVWHEGDRTLGHVYDEALARRGFVVVAIDVRKAPHFLHPAASADVATAVRWVRSSSERLGVDPSRIALVGSSSGGHLALLAACRPNAPEHLGKPLTWGAQTPVTEDIDASVACVGALWPPTDPLTRYRYALDSLQEDMPAARREHYEVLRRGTEWYFGDQETMYAASIARIVAAGEAPHLPPVWVCYPELDINVPFAIIEDLQEAWTQAGGTFQVSVYPEQKHAFGHWPGGATDQFIDELSAFITEVCLDSAGS